MFCNQGMWPYFAGFTASTPALPQLYFDVQTSEQRWKEICVWLKKLTEFADATQKEVSEMPDTFFKDPRFDAAIGEQIDKWVSETSQGTTYDQLKTYGFIYKEL